MALLFEGVNIIAVWYALGGGALHRNYGRAFWRGGDGANVRIYPDSGSWHDFAQNLGGGILSLVQTALGCDRRSAWAWLTETFGVQRVVPSVAEKSKYNQRLALARPAAERLCEVRDEEILRLKASEQFHAEECRRLDKLAHKDQDIEAYAEAEAHWEIVKRLTARRDALRAEKNMDVLDALLKEGWDKA